MPHLVIYETTRKIDSLFLNIFSYQNQKWKSIYRDKFLRQSVGPPHYSDLMICNDRNKNEKDLKLTKIYSQIQSAITYHYLIYKPVNDSFIYVKNFSKIYSPKTNKDFSKIYGYLPLGCVDMRKEYTSWEWKNDDVVLVEKIEVDCCNYETKSDTCSFFQIKNDNSRIKIKNSSIPNEYKSLPPTTLSLK